MHKDWLKQKITVEEAEAEYLYCIPEFGIRTGEYDRTKWANLKAQMQPVDELWTFDSPKADWQNMAGRAGVALVRNGEVVASIVTVMN